MELMKLAAGLSALLLGGCFVVPTPMAPGIGGSIGEPHHGVLVGGLALPQRGEGYKRLRDDDRRFGNPRLVRAIERAAAAVEAARPGSPKLVVGDMSAPHGGFVEGHRSHRTGRDVDLLLYLMTPDGRPLENHGFPRILADGLGKGGTKAAPDLVRLDVERTWIMVKALVEDEEAQVQRLFVARWVEAQIIEYAVARGETDELVLRSAKLLVQPGDSSPHDDHIHVRIACTPEEEVAGCMGGGPRWPWLLGWVSEAEAGDEELVAELAGPFDDDEAAGASATKAAAAD
jgi:penicillin-insensitive murein DD-endopeptidase